MTGFLGGHAAIAGALSHDAYVWQRAWTAPVRQAANAHGAAFSEFILLKGEVVWKDQRPELIRVAVPYEALTNRLPRLGLALRIGSFNGPFATNDSNIRFLADTARSILSEARAAGLSPMELQLDFDCAASRLDGYLLWLETIRRQVAPVPVTITALPSWLGQPGFAPLVAASDGYVLQVHSLQRPRNASAPFVLCDTQAAERAVARAGELGAPFRVALPTYAYLVAYDSSGKFVGLSAEGPGKTWPESAVVRRVEADPLPLAALVRQWTTNRPATLRGIIWYRLPVADDSLNWRWPTLTALIEGRTPVEKVQARPRRVDRGLFELDLENTGELDAGTPLKIHLSWPDQSGARVVAADGLRGFGVVERDRASLSFQPRPGPFRLPAGEKWTIAWLRFNKDEVEIVPRVSQLN